MSAGNNRMTGQQSPTSVAIHTFTASLAVAVGDLMYRDPTTKKVLPLTSYTWTTDAATTRRSATQYFAGLSNLRRLSSETDTPDGVLYDEGEAKFPCSALGAAQKAGDLVGFAQDGSNSTLSNSIVAIVTDRAEAFGVLSRPAASGATSVFVRYQAQITNPKAYSPASGLLRNEVNTTDTTAAAATLTVAAVVGGMITRSGPTAIFTDTTPTAALIIAGLPVLTQVGASWELAIKNTTAFAQTLAGGTSVTLTGQTIIPPNSVGRFLLTYATTTTVTMVGQSVGPMTTGPLPVSTNLTTVGAGTPTAAGIAGGHTNRTGSTAAFTDTTDTAANIISALPNANIGQAFEWRYYNNTLGNATLVGGTGVTITGTIIPKCCWAKYLVTYTAAGTITMVQVETGDNVILPNSLYVTGALQSATFNAGDITGSKSHMYDNTGTTPGNLTTRTAAQMFADIPNCQIGFTYELKIRNSSGSANTATIVAGSNVTLTGTMTIAQTVTRTFNVTFPTTTTCTIQSMGISAAGA